MVTVTGACLLVRGKDCSDTELSLIRFFVCLQFVEVISAAW